jgi:hypothetical protein
VRIMEHYWCDYDRNSTPNCIVTLDAGNTGNKGPCVLAGGSVPGSVLLGGLIVDGLDESGWGIGLQAEVVPGGCA